MIRKSLMRGLAGCCLMAFLAMTPVSSIGAGDMDSSTTHKVIGVSLPHMSSPARVSMAEEIKKAVADLGKGNWEVIITDGQNNTAKQTNDVEDMIHRRVDVIIMCPIQTEPLAPVSKRVLEAGIPLILIDRTISTEDYTCYVGGDNYMIGVQAAEYIGSKLKGEGNVAIIQGALGGSATNDRQAGFLDTLKKKYPGIKIVADVSGEWKRDVGMRVMEDIIQVHGDILNALYSHGDNATLGALQAMEAAGVKYVVVTADGQKEIFDRIKSGSVDMCIAFPGGGKESVGIAKMIFEDKPFGEKIQMIPVPEITKDNVEAMYHIGY